MAKVASQRVDQMQDPELNFEQAYADYRRLGYSESQYKQYKGLKKESLRDNMTNIELALNILAEASTTEISKAQNPKGFKQSAAVARKGGKYRTERVLVFWLVPSAE